MEPENGHCENPPCGDAGPFRYCPINGCGWMEEHAVTSPPTDMAKVNSGDAEDCEMCSLIEGESCAFHQGVSAGVAWMSEMMKAAAEDPEIVQDVLAARSRRTTFDDMRSY